MIFIISGPSGAGKTTLIDFVLHTFENFTLSVSHTTRPPRKGEKNGVDYYFVSKKEFEEMIKNQEFVEYAEVYGNYYGTSKKEIERLKHKHIIFDVDIRGGLNLISYFKDSVSIFIMPPDFETLKKRILNRKTETEQSFKTRMHQVLNQSLAYEHYTYTIINDDLEVSKKEISAIITAEECKTKNREEKAKKIIESFKYGLEV